MVATLQILISLLAVIAAVGVAAKRLKLPPAILLVVTGVVLALIPGLPRIELAPELVLLLVLPPIIYSSAVAMSWREFRFNLRPDLAARRRLRRLHHRRGRRGQPLAAGSPLAGRLRAGGHRVAARRRGAAVDRSPHAAAAAHPGHPRGRGTGQRCDGADPLSLRRRRRSAPASSRFGQAAGTVRRHRGRRDSLGHRRRLADAAPAPLGRRSAHRDPALGADAVSRLLAAGASRRLRRARHRHHRPLHQLERPAADQRRDAPAGHLLLGFPDLPRSRAWSS